MGKWIVEEGTEMEFEVVYKLRNEDTGELREMYRTRVHGGFVYITASQTSKGRSESSFFVKS